MKTGTGKVGIEQVNPKAIDLISAVKSLHSCQDLSKLIRDSENGISELKFENGSSIQIDFDGLSKVPIHLLARILQSKLDEDLLKYVLIGIRLLHNLYDAAPRHHKLEQIMSDDIPLLSQLIELIFYVLIVLNYYTKEHQYLTPVTHLHSTIAASSLLLFEKAISPHPVELANFLVNHPKVHLFMDAAFSVVRTDIEVLRVEMQSHSTNSLSPTAEESIKHLCVQCEASLKFLHSLYQQNSFRDCLLKHKELCREAGFLWLVRSVLDLDITVFHNAQFVVGAVCRMKSKVLAMLLYLCEIESVSYLDEVARTPESLSLAKSVVLEVLELLKKLFSGYSKELSSCMGKDTPKGLLQLNALRLADIFSDDSNFRSYVIAHITKVLTTLFSLPHVEFLSTWCASDLQVWEEDATLDYDPFLASGWVLNLLSMSNPLNLMSSEYAVISSNMPRASYAHQRTSLLVKVIANLHCFNPDICNDEKDLFLNKFFKCLQREVPDLSNESSSDLAAEKIASISRNLRSLLSHAESLIPSYLNEEDVQLFREFMSQLEPLMSMLELKVSDIQEAHSINGCSPLLSRKVSPNQYNGTSDLQEVQKALVLLESDQSNVGMDIDQVDDELREYKKKGKDNSGKVEACGLKEMEGNAQNVESSGSDSSSTREKNSLDQSNDVQEDQKTADIKFAEKQQRKRKRNIMNDKQTSIIERALLNIPDMHRNVAVLQSMADQLSNLGPEVTSSQLKNWLNNRKAKLARVANSCGLAEGYNAHNDNQGGSEIKVLNDSSKNPGEDLSVPSAPQAGQEESGIIIPRTGCNENPRNIVSELVDSTPVEGQYVMVVDQEGTVIGRGKVYQVHGIWYGKNLKELGTCVVDIVELKGDKLSRLPHPFEDTGTSFYNAEKQHGVMRVLWDSKKLLVVQRPLISGTPCLTRG